MEPPRGKYDSFVVAASAAIVTGGVSGVGWDVDLLVRSVGSCGNWLTIFSVDLSLLLYSTHSSKSLRLRASGGEVMT